MTDTYRWNDDRLDDLARRVENNSRLLEAMHQVRIELEGLRSNLGNVDTGTQQCIKELRELKDDLEAQQQTQHEERRADRKWMVMTLLTVAGLVIAALAIFIG